MRWFSAVHYLSICFYALQPALCQPASPILPAHAHNDYRNRHPLIDAVDLGYASIEADVYLKKGQLLVAHLPSGCRKRNTLRNLYLEPLRKLYETDKIGNYNRKNRPLILLIDLKTGGPQTLQAVKEALVPYHHMLTRWEGNLIHPGKVMVLLSGNAIRYQILHDSIRYAGIDGRLEDTSSYPATVMPLISCGYSQLFNRPLNRISGSQKEALLQLVNQLHANGYHFRIWGLPNKRKIWEEMKSYGIDYYNIDRLKKFARWYAASGFK